MDFERRRKVETELDIAPLVDVTLSLLIFFMLAANFMVHPGIKITLPQAATAKPQREENVTVFISRDGKIYLGNRKVSINALKDVLKEKLKTSQKKTVVLKADEKINLGLAVKVMDITKQAGAEGLVISTQLKAKNADER